MSRNCSVKPSNVARKPKPAPPRRAARCAAKPARAFPPDTHAPFESRFGSITVQRTRGSCQRCRKWRVPADAAPGQFWSQAGDEAPMCLETFWRNDRWHLLFPHTSFNPARN